jgi:hypothetical protein
MSILQKHSSLLCKLHQIGVYEIVFVMDSGKRILFLVVKGGTLGPVL